MEVLSVFWQGLLTKMERELTEVNFVGNHFSSWLFAHKSFRTLLDSCCVRFFLEIFCSNSLCTLKLGPRNIRHADEHHAKSN